MGQECGILWEIIEKLDDFEVKNAFHKHQSFRTNQQRRSQIISWQYVPQDKADSISSRFIKSRNVVNVKNSTKTVCSIRLSNILHPGDKFNSCQHHHPRKGSLGQFYNFKRTHELRQDEKLLFEWLCLVKKGSHCIFSQSLEELDLRAVLTLRNIFIYLRFSWTFNLSPSFLRFTHACLPQLLISATWYEFLYEARDNWPVFHARNQLST